MSETHTERWQAYYNEVAGDGLMPHMSRAKDIPDPDQIDEFMRQSAEQRLAFLEDNGAVSDWDELDEEAERAFRWHK